MPVVTTAPNVSTAGRIPGPPPADRPHSDSTRPVRIRREPRAAIRDPPGGLIGTKEDAMSERTPEPELLLAETRESEVVAALHDLNAHYIRAFIESDVAWYRRHLSDDS